MSSPEASFTPTSGNASLTTPAQASSLRKSGHVLLKSHPCKISSLSTSKPGKHGHAKLNIEGYDIFTHKKYEDVFPSHATVEVPVVTKVEYQVLMVARDWFLSLWRVEDEVTRGDLRVPEGEARDKLRKLMAEEKEVGVIVVRAMGRDMVLEVKEIGRDED
ncbi:MAG: Eukaryotic translation initiation factor 5A [Bogoriella megaspora]|nr:MAG: Eukaryotic translation initiation factor 5A [Bogoriella megaspora]